MRLPVKRVLCPSGNKTVTTPDSVNVSYTVRFSVLSAGRVSLLSQEIAGADVAHNATDKQREDAHYTWETAGT